MQSNNKRLGLLLTHMFVREDQSYKFDQLKYVINFFKRVDSNFFIVVSGHGKPLPDNLHSLVDDIYWEEDIDERQLGRGHAKFCIEGFEILKKNKIDNCIKTRYCDIFENISLATQEISKRKLMFTEQTCFKRKMLGDLLMAGNTDMLHQIWSASDWDYSKSGLYNLYDNMEIYAKENNLSLKKYLELNCTFHKPEDLLWYTIEHNWSQHECGLLRPLCEDHLWGKQANYEYYGGF